VEQQLGIISSDGIEYVIWQGFSSRIIFEPSQPRRRKRTPTILKLNTAVFICSLDLNLTIHDAAGVLIASIHTVVTW